MAYIISKIVPKSLGNGKAVLALDDNDNTVIWLGRIVGFADGVKSVEDPKKPGTYFTGITGVFRAFADKTDKETGEVTSTISESGVLYLPSGVHDNLVATVMSLPKDTGSVVRIAYKLGTRRATNIAGYEWVAEELIPADPNADKFASVMEAITGPKEGYALAAAQNQQAQIAAPVENAPASVPAAPQEKHHAKK